MSRLTSTRRHLRPAPSFPRPILCICFRSDGATRTTTNRHPTNRYFPYYITVAALVIVFIVILLWLIFQRRLLPSIVMIGGFMLFVLWLTGLIVTSVQLWGPSGSVSSNCNAAVFDRNPTGQTLETLAWLQQRSICQGWQAVFALGLVGAIFLLWIMIMAYQVFADNA